MTVNWTKIGLVIVGVIMLAILAVNIKSCVDASRDRDAMHQEIIEMKEFSQEVVRSQSRYATKEEIEKIISKNMNLDEIKRDLNNHDAIVRAVQTVLAQSIGRNQTGVGTGWTKPRPKDPDGNPAPTCPDGSKCEDPYGYWENGQFVSITEPFAGGTEVPVGSVGFEAWKEKPWTINVHPRDYHVTTVLGQDKKGRHYAYNKFEIGVDGEKYPVPIRDSKIVEQLPEASFSWWNPRVGIGVHGGVGFNTANDDILTATAAPALSFSPFSYGQTETKPDWIFARVGAGFDLVHRTASFSVAPAMWNIGSAVDVIQNTYIGPVVSVDHEGRIGVGAGITTDF